MIATDSPSKENIHIVDTPWLTCVSVPPSKGNLKAFLKLLPLAILRHLTLTDTSANECVPAHCRSISTSTDTVCLSALFFAGSHGPRTASGNGKCRIKTPGAREWWCIACVGSSTNGVPSTHPASCFRPSCPSLDRLPSRWKICFHFPCPQASFSDIRTISAVCKNKHPARSCVQNSPGCQNKFIPTKHLFPGQQQTQDDLPVPFCQNVLNPALITLTRNRQAHRINRI